MKTVLFVFSGLVLAPSVVAAMAGETASWGILIGVILFCTAAIIGTIEDRLPRTRNQEPNENLARLRS